MQRRYHATCRLTAKAQNSFIIAARRIILHHLALGDVRFVAGNLAQCSAATGWCTALAPGARWTEQARAAHLHHCPKRAPRPHHWASGPPARCACVKGKHRKGIGKQEYAFVESTTMSGCACARAERQRVANVGVKRAPPSPCAITSQCVTPSPAAYTLGSCRREHSRQRPHPKFLQAFDLA